MPIFSVYIDEGCITCDACEDVAPDVFEVTDDSCFIKPAARLDGGFDRNAGQSGLKPEIASSLSDDILDAADACPVEVIMVLDEAPSGAAEAEEPSEPETMESTPGTVVEDVEVGDGLEQLLAVGEIGRAHV